MSLAHEPLNMRVSPATRTQTPRYAPERRCVHNADHLAHDTPLSAFVTEVVCDVGAAPRRDLTDSKRGELRYTWTRACLACR